MKHSTDRILTTHCGSLAGPKDLLEIMKAKVNAKSTTITPTQGGSEAQCLRLSATRSIAASILSPTVSKGSPRTSLEPHVSVVNEFSALGITRTNSVHHREPVG